MNKEEKKLEYWNHFLTIESFWGYGVTRKRLERIKPMIWDDNDFWFDVLQRHRGVDCSPEEMRDMDKFNYDHCFGNMAGMIYQSLLENKIIKP